ncbi:hypothetical protein BN440_2950 [Erwinia amylovora MR1]|nr:hypothetical protein BN440_2950 [Erwinia amylovora MR1]
MLSLYSSTDGDGQRGEAGCFDQDGMAGVNKKSAQ